MKTIYAIRNVDSIYLHNQKYLQYIRNISIHVRKTLEWLIPDNGNTATENKDWDYFLYNQIVEQKFEPSRKFIPAPNSELDEIFNN